MSPEGTILWQRLSRNEAFYEWTVSVALLWKWHHQLWYLSLPPQDGSYAGCFRPGRTGQAHSKLRLTAKWIGFGGGVRILRQARCPYFCIINLKIGVSFLSFLPLRPSFLLFFYLPAELFNLRFWYICIVYSIGFYTAFYFVTLIAFSFLGIKKNPELLSKASLINAC